MIPKPIPAAPPVTTYTYNDWSILLSKLGTCVWRYFAIQVGNVRVRIKLIASDEMCHCEFGLQYTLVANNSVFPEGRSIVSS